MASVFLGKSVGKSEIILEHRSKQLQPDRGMQASSFYRRLFSQMLHPIVHGGMYWKRERWHSVNAQTTKVNRKHSYPISNVLHMCPPSLSLCSWSICWCRQERYHLNAERGRILIGTICESYNLSLGRDSSPAPNYQITKEQRALLFLIYRSIGPVPLSFHTCLHAKQPTGHTQEQRLRIQCGQ